MYLYYREHKDNRYEIANSFEKFKKMFYLWLETPIAVLDKNNNTKNIINRTVNIGIDRTINYFKNKYNI